MSTYLGGTYSFITLIVDCVFIVPVLVALGFSKFYLKYRDSKDRRTRFGPWAFLAALLLVLTEWIFRIADVALVWDTWYSQQRIGDTYLTLATIASLAGGLSTLFALVVIASMVQDWTDGRRRRTEDIIIRVTAWLLLLLTLVRLGIDIATTATHTDSPIYFQTLDAEDCDRGLEVVAHGIDLTYDTLALLFILWVAFQAITNFSSYGGKNAYRVLVTIAISFMAFILAISVADDVVYLVPRVRVRYASLRGYYCDQTDLGAELYHIIEPAFFDGFYATLLLLLAMAARSGCQLVKHVDEIHSQNYPNQPVQPSSQQQPVEHHASAAAPEMQHTSAV